jgi:hypothetical protein
VDWELWSTWIQFAIWGFGCIGIIAKALAGERVLPDWAGRILGSLIFLRIVVFLGLISSVASFLIYRHQNPWSFDGGTKLEQVVDRTFSEEVVDVDGKAFLHCHFHDVKFKYNGRAPFTIKDCGLGGHLIITSDNPSVDLAWVLARALGMMPHVPFMGPNEEPRPIPGPANQPSQLR